MSKSISSQQLLSTVNSDIDFGIEEKTLELTEVSILIPNPATTTNTNTNVRAVRQGSNANLITNTDGTVSVVRRNSDMIGASIDRLSTSSQPNLLAVLSPNQQRKQSAPVLNAADALERTKGQGDYYEHLWPLDSLAEKYETHIDVADVKKSHGLTTDKVKQLLDEFGLNVLTPPPRVPLWLLFLLQFTNLLMVLLLLTGLMTFILYAIQPSNPTNLYLGVLLYIVVFLTCYETFSQEAKSDQLMEKFRALVPDNCTVIRDGILKPLPAAELVPGDIINLKSGDKIPADCRVILASSLKVDQASLTGESEPVDVYVEAKSPVALEAKNIIFNGSLCVDGTCTAVVIRTGDGTLIGKMVDLTGDVGKSDSTLKQDIVYFVRFLTVFALCQAVLIFIVGLSKRLNPVTVFVNGFVIIMIGNVPQGLPTTITACLFIVAERMGRQNVFVKKLDIIENLGSCTCICTDKTGTLTQNLMSVANLWFMNCKQTCKEFPGRMQNEVTDGNGKLSPQMRTLMEVAALNSRIALEMKPSKADPKIEILTPTGDATELGLYRFFDSLCQIRFPGKGIEEYRELNKKVHEVPFNSSNKWQMSIHSMSEQNGEQIMFVKGAPDVLLDKCSRYLSDSGEIKDKDSEFDHVYTTAYEDFGGNGERVLGFAMLPLDKPFEDSVSENSEYPELLKERLVGKKHPAEAIKNLIFVGLVTLRDPPRDEVPQAVRDCHSAGVKVVMVTGDHPLTAEAIARNIGLITKDTPRSLAKKRGVPMESITNDDPEVGAVVIRGVEISGSELEGIKPLTEDQWKVLLSKDEIVFARTSPENKLTIVNEFTKAGHVTAMTGDGKY